jgi:hypothetical protein
MLAKGQDRRLLRGILGHVNIDVTQNQELGFTPGQSPKTNCGEWRGIAKPFHEKAGWSQDSFVFTSVDSLPSSRAASVAILPSALFCEQLSLGGRWVLSFQ